MRPVPGFSKYFVTEDGVVYGLRGKPLRLDRNRGAYLYVCVTTDDGRRCSQAVHRLMALTFLGPRPAGMEVRHLDGNKDNNAASNLAYGTRSENVLDQVRHRTHGHLNRDFCKSGDHPWVPENIGYSPDRRYCIPCRQRQNRRRTERRRGTLYSTPLRGVA